MAIPARGRRRAHGHRRGELSLKQALDQAPLRLGLNAGLLPFGVRWFYLQALGTAIQREDRWSLGWAAPSEELARLLGFARGAARVVEIGARTEWTAIALAVGEEKRSIVSFANPPDARERQHYVHLVDPVVRARIDFREDSATRMSSAAPASGDLVLVDASGGYETDAAAIASGEQIVRPGGLLVVRGYARPDIREAIEKLRLEGTVANGFFVGHKGFPVAALEYAEAGVEAAEATAEAPSREPVGARSVLIALALTGALAGVAVGVGGSLSGFGTDRPAEEETLNPGQGAGPGGLRGANGPNGSPARRGDAPASRRLSRSRESRSRSSTSSPRPATEREGTDGFSGIGAKGLSGTGARNLGTLRLSRPTILNWTSSAGSLSISSQDWRLRTRRKEGSTVLSPGAYRDFRVRAKGDWSLRLRSR